MKNRINSIIKSLFLTGGVIASTLFVGCAANHAEMALKAFRTAANETISATKAVDPAIARTATATAINAFKEAMKAGSSKVDVLIVAAANLGEEAEEEADAWNMAAQGMSVAAEAWEEAETAARKAAVEADTRAAAQAWTAAAEKARAAALAAEAAREAALRAKSHASALSMAAARALSFAEEGALWATLKEAANAVVAATDLVGATGTAQDKRADALIAANAALVAAEAAARRSE